MMLLLLLLLSDLCLGTRRQYKNTHKNDFGRCREMLVFLGSVKLRRAVAKKRGCGGRSVRKSVDIEGKRWGLRNIEEREDVVVNREMCATAEKR